MKQWLLVMMVLAQTRGASANCVSMAAFRTFPWQEVACATHCVLTLEGVLQGDAQFVPETGNPVAGVARPLEGVLDQVTASEVRSLEPLQLSTHYRVRVGDSTVAELTTLDREPPETATLDSVSASEVNTRAECQDTPFFSRLPTPPESPPRPHRVTRERTDVFVTFTSNLPWLLERQPTTQVLADVWTVKKGGPLPVVNEDGMTYPAPLLEHIPTYAAATMQFDTTALQGSPVEGATTYRVAMRLVDSLGRSTPIVTSAEFKTSPESSTTCSQGTVGLWPVLLVVLARRRRAA